MTTVARLSADLTANSTSFESSLKRANSAMNQAKNQWNSALSSAGRSFNTFDGHVRNTIGSVVDLKTQIGGLATTVAASLSVQKIIQYSDAWRQLEGRLKVATGGTADLAAVQTRLFEVAQKNMVPLADAVDAYARLNLSLNDAQKGQYDLVKITDLLSKTLLISGTNAAGAATFYQQFGQAASSDFKAIGQEIQTFADQNSYFYKILQTEAMKTGKSLKDLAKDGGLSYEFIANALTKASGQIARDAGQIPITVGKALTQLDNAFLQFIGQSQAVQSGTSSIAVAINALAENFTALATTVGAVAVVFGTRLAISLSAAGIAAVRSFTASAAAATAYTAAMNLAAGATANATRMSLALAKAQQAAAGSVAASTIVVGANGAAVVASTTAMSLGARAAAISITTLAGATTLLGRAVAFLGGPVGVAVIAAFALMTLKTDEAAEAQQRMNDRLADHRDQVAGFIIASKERRKEILDATNENIANLMREYEAINALYAAYQRKSFAGRFWQNLKGSVGIGMGKEQIVAEGAALENALNALNKDKKTLEEMNASVPPPNAPNISTGTGKKKKDTYKDILDSLKEETEQLEIQTSMYGQKEAAIDKAQRAAKIQNQLTAAGIKLNAQQQAAIDEYLGSIEKQTALQKEQADQQKKLEEQERDREQALNQLGASFESAFENAITSGEELSDVLNGLLDDIEKIMTRVIITEPIANSVGDFAKGLFSGGSGSGFLGSLFSWLPSFDVGTSYVPHDMVANIHKGERILTAAENKQLMQGGIGGGTQVNLVIQNNNGSAVSQRAEQTDNGMNIRVMIDEAVADNISKRGSSTSNALKAMQGRTLIRR